MNSSIRFFAISLFILSASSAGLAQPSPADGFVSLTDRFAIALPADSYEYKPIVPLKIGKQDYNLRLYKWDTPKGLFTVGCMLGTRDLEQPDVAKAFFADFRKLILSRLQQSGKLLSEKNILVENHPGIELIIDSPAITTAFRIFVVKNRFYMLSLAVQHSQTELIASSEQIVSSFRILSRSEIANLRDRQIDFFEWSPLPQQPFVGRTRTDAEDENLRGQVKGILTEVESFFGSVLFDSRTAILMSEFNQQGYLLKEIHYASESPTSITSYGYLKGGRAMLMAMSRNSGAVKEDPKDSYPLRKTIQITRELKYKYDSASRLLERIVTESGGKVSEKTVFKYSANQRQLDTWLYFSLLSGRTSTHSRMIELLDDQGNPSEATEIWFQELPDNYYSTSAPNPITNRTTSGTIERKTSEEKYLYAYEYDSQGNWVKRTTLKLSTEKGVVSRMPLHMTYRTITYY